MLSYDYAYYEPESKLKAEDENIKDWEKYFNNQLSYEETNALVKIVGLRHLQSWKKGDLTHQLSKTGKRLLYKIQGRTGLPDKS